jgi:hypothetical protein
LAAGFFSVTPAAPRLDPYGNMPGQGCGSHCTVPQAQDPYRTPPPGMPEPQPRPPEPIILRYPPPDTDRRSPPDAGVPDAPTDAPTDASRDPWRKGVGRGYQLADDSGYSWFTLAEGGSSFAFDTLKSSASLHPSSCAACTFENPDRFRQIFLEHYTDVSFGIWGIELNPEGPWATPQQQAEAGQHAQ